MIRSYKKQKLIQKLSQKCNLYKASTNINNNPQYFFMYQYLQLNQCDQYNFKMIKKFVISVNILGLIQRFQENQRTYFITDYAESDLLLEQFQQENQVFKLDNALKYFLGIVDILEEIHGYKVIYRNLRLENVKIKDNQLKLADFSLSQAVRRKQRYFQIIGVNYFLAPEFFGDDGYGYQADIWAAGVCLYFMLSGEYPFKMDGKNQQQMKQQISKKCKKGFKLSINLSECKKSKQIQYLQNNKDLQHFFKHIFQYQYSSRITLPQIRSHPILHQILKSQQILSLNSQSPMSIILQQQQYPSLFISLLHEYPCHYEFHKQQTILSFMQFCSQLFMLQFVNEISQNVRVLVNFSVLKAAVMKVKYLQQVMYGKKQPDFKIDKQEWNKMRKCTAFNKVKSKIQKKKKIIQMLFKSAVINVQPYTHNMDKNKKQFYTEDIPEDFASIKHEYRKNISLMYQTVKEILKKKQNKIISRKSCENMVRLTILCMINRIFNTECLKDNFQVYFNWAKKQSLEDLEEWIQNQKIQNLKIFIKNITSKYMQ